jgi:hypothetical protein
VTPAERNERLDVEPIRIGEQTIDGAHPHNPRPRPSARTRRPGAHLAESLDRDSRALEGAPELRERRLGGRLDTVASR